MLQCQETFLRTWAPSENSDQLAHLCILIKSSLGTFWLAKDTKFFHVDKKDSDQTA